LNLTGLRLDSRSIFGGEADLDLDLDFRRRFFFSFFDFFDLCFDFFRPRSSSDRRCFFGFETTFSFGGSSFSASASTAANRTGGSGL
jgi:hypothetical protein